LHAIIVRKITRIIDPKQDASKTSILNYFYLTWRKRTVTKHSSDNHVINHTCEEYFKMFSATLNHHAPRRFVSRKEQHPFQKPRLTKGII